MSAPISWRAVCPKICHNCHIDHFSPERFGIANKTPSSCTNAIRDCHTSTHAHSQKDHVFCSCSLQAPKHEFQFNKGHIDSSPMGRMNKRTIIPF